MNYGGWDSHGNQRRIPAILANDPNNPFESRGIESGLRDIFGGQLESLASPSDPNALHGGFLRFGSIYLKPTSIRWCSQSLASLDGKSVTMAMPALIMEKAI